MERIDVDSMPARKTSHGSGPHRYEIRVAGHLSAHWEASFQGMTLTNEPGGTAVLRGPVPDQAALHGLLARVRDLGLPLLSLSRLAPDSAHAAPETESPPASPLGQERRAGEPPAAPAPPAATGANRRHGHTQPIHQTEPEEVSDVHQKEIRRHHRRRRGVPRGDHQDLRPE
ncbi:MAG TPA: hypothetical protein VHS99_00985 [Chloroflexota bacterium]|nr:hypothetical protein [Chloroflexota bacterium]